MARVLTIGAAQSGPVQAAQSRQQVVERLIAMMRQAREQGCDLVVFTEVALVPFFPHWYMEDQAEIDAYFEREMPSPATQPLFDEARNLGIGFHLGFAELADEGGQRRHYNSCILVDKSGTIVGKYRKIHLPGFTAEQPDDPFQNLEKRYFDPGNLGFRVWRVFGGIVGMCICYDRRWPESYRMLALQGAEVILLGYNTPVDNSPSKPGTMNANFHNMLCMQAGALQNASWVVGVAKAGVEEGIAQIGQSCIIAPSGEVVAMATTLEDELVVARCDLDRVVEYRRESLEFEKNRRIEDYGLITQQAGIVLPPE